MDKHLSLLVIIISLALAAATNEDLPICPTNFQFFPQTLPMHCRMPTGADVASYPGMPGSPQAQVPPQDKQPGVPMPSGMPVPLPMPGPVSMPGPLPFPGPLSMMPMPALAPAHKLPVIVMPFYSPDPSYKKPGRPKRPGIWKKPKRPYEFSDTSSDTDTSDSSNTDSSDSGLWKGKKRGWRKNARRSNRHHSHHPKKRHSKKKDLLTPVLQYVTNDGYVIYEKKISKGEAKDWLKVNNEKQRNIEANASKNDENLDVSVNVDQNKDVEEADIDNRRVVDTYNDEREKEEMTTEKKHIRRHFKRKAAAAVFNKRLHKRGCAFLVIITQV